MGVGCWLMVEGCWLRVVGCGLLVVGGPINYQPITINRCRPINYQPTTNNQTRPVTINERRCSAAAHHDPAPSCLHLLGGEGFEHGGEGAGEEEGVVVEPEVGVPVGGFGGGFPGEAHALVPVEGAVAGDDGDLGEALPDGFRGAVGAAVVDEEGGEGGVLGEVLREEPVEAPQGGFPAVVDGEQNRKAVLGG